MGHLIYFCNPTDLGCRRGSASDHDSLFSGEDEGPDKDSVPAPASKDDADKTAKPNSSKLSGSKGPSAYEIAMRSRPTPIIRSGRPKEAKMMITVELLSLANDDDE